MISKQRVRKLLEHIGYSYVGKGRMMRSPTLTAKTKYTGLNLSWRLLVNIAVDSKIDSISVFKGNMTKTFIDLENQIYGLK